MKKTKCPICSETLELEEGLEVGEIIYCPGCDRDLRIISFNPTKVKEDESSSKEYVDEEFDDMGYS